MFLCAVKLSGVNKLLTIKSSWVDQLNTIENIRSGYKRYQLFKVFYSPHDDIPANFHLEILSDINANVPACYMAYISSVFGNISLNNK